MGVTVKSMDLSGVERKGEAAAKAFVAAYALAARDDSNRKAPFQTGALRQSGTVRQRDKSATVEWGGGAVRYAAVHYYAPGYWDYTTPGTGPRWFDKAKAQRGAAWLAAGSKAVRSVCNG